jgi:hypothetical protein
VYSSPEEAAQGPGRRSRTDRLGLGVHRLFGEWVRLAGEVAVGDSSVGAGVGGSCHINERMQLYTNSGLDAKPIDGAMPALNGKLISGARWRISEKAAVFGEERLKAADGQRGATHAFGTDLRPAPHLTWGTTLQMGETNDPFVGTREHWGGSVSIGYTRNGVRYAGNLELHQDDGEGSFRRETWNACNEFEFPVVPGWRLLGRLNASLTSAHEDNSVEGARIENVTELTRRRSGKDSFKMLMKYVVSPDRARDWQTDLQVGLFSPVNETIRMGIGYNFNHFSNGATSPSSDDRGVFLEIAGTF